MAGRYYKLSPAHFMTLVLVVALYIALLIVSFNKHQASRELAIQGVAQRAAVPGPPPLPHGFDPVDAVLGWRNKLPDGPLVHRAKLRLSESIVPRNAGGVKEDEHESSVSGDSAGYDTSSNAVFSHPFAPHAPHGGPNIRRIYPKGRHKSHIAFKPKKTDVNQLDLMSKGVDTIAKLREDALSGNGLNEAGGNIEKTERGTRDRSTCVPHNNIVYIKTHKTGSSTLQNIFLRYGDERNLTFALPMGEVYIQSVRQFELASIVPAPPGKQWNILANHVRFFYNDFKKLMPEDTKYVTILRRSSDQFRSMYTYFVLKNQYKATVEQFSLNPEYFYERFGEGKYKRHEGRNPMLFDLGMEKSFNNDPRLIQQYIEFLDAKFDLVLITEYYEESLILLKEVMCWSMRSLAHVNNKIRVSLAAAAGARESTTPSVEDERAAIGVAKRLDRWNTGDVRMYDHFNRTLWKRIEAYGRDRMAADVKELRVLCRTVERECMNGTTVRDISRGSLQQTGLLEYVVKSNQIKNMTCTRLAMSPKTFTSHLKNKHIRNFRKDAG